MNKFYNLIFFSWGKTLCIWVYNPVLDKGLCLATSLYEIWWIWWMILMMCKNRVYNFSRDVSEKVFRVSDQVQHKSACTVKEAGFLRFEILAIN